MRVRVTPYDGNPFRPVRECSVSVNVPDYPYVDGVRRISLDMTDEHMRRVFRLLHMKYPDRDPRSFQFLVEYESARWSEKHEEESSTYALGTILRGIGIAMVIILVLSMIGAAIYAFGGGFPFKS